MESKYLLSAVAIVALLSMSMMFMQAGVSPIGKATGTPSLGVQQDIADCTERTVAQSGADESDAYRYCECVEVYSNQYDCERYLNVE
jgi:hypothetical protein